MDIQTTFLNFGSKKDIDLRTKLASKNVSPDGANIRHKWYNVREFVFAADED